MPLGEDHTAHLARNILTPGPHQQAPVPTHHVEQSVTAGCMGFARLPQLDQLPLPPEHLQRAWQQRCQRSGVAAGDKGMQVLELYDLMQQNQVLDWSHVLDCLANHVSVEWDLAHIRQKQYAKSSVKSFTHVRKVTSLFGHTVSCESGRTAPAPSPEQSW